jgi:hypothetical protein
MTDSIRMPLTLKFSFWLGMEIKITDNSQNTVCFVKQKLWDFKEHTTVYSDDSKSKQLFEIKADRIIDWGANYMISTPEGQLGFVRRKGWKSIWKATYEIYDANSQHLYTIKEKNPFVKVMDALLEEVPILNMFSGFFFNPKYEVRDMNDKHIYTLAKIPRFFGREFTLIDESQNTIDNPELVLCSVIQMLCLEKARG